MELRMPVLALVAVLAMAGLAAAEPGGTTPPPPSQPPQCSPDHPCCNNTASCPPPQCNADHPCPPPCTAPPGAPCHNAQFNECMHSSSGTQSSREAACIDQYCAHERNDWCAKYCQNHGDKPYCASQPGEGDPEAIQPCLDAAGDDAKARNKCYKEYCEPRMDACKAFCRDHPAARLCGPHPKGDERHIAFDPAADGLANLTVNGHLVLASVRLEATEASESSHTDHTLTMTAGDNRLELHDDASGFLRFEGPDATVTLTFPPGVTHKATEGPKASGARIDYPGGGVALLEAATMAWTDDRTVAVTGFMSFHVAPGQFNPAGAGDPELRDKLQGALAKGDRVGAEIRVNRGHDSEVFAYGRVNVTLRSPPDRPTRDHPLQITLSSDLPEGRAFVLHINRSVLDVAEGKVVLRYFDLPDGPNGTARTEVVFHRATDLDDILDPTDDAGQPEYYIVRDQDGLQVMVTVPHWSAHMIELSSLADLVQPSVLVGIAAGAAGMAVAAVALFVPRRRDV
ncbi:MAG: hypothetical protein ABR562_05125 [Thermoplasmatota archaeon]